MERETPQSPERPPLLQRADLWAGLVCLGLGAAVVWIGADYPLGTGGRIGPGYAPRLLGLLLMGIGLLLFVRAPWTSDGIETMFRPHPAVLVLAAVLAFALVFALHRDAFLRRHLPVTEGQQDRLSVGIDRQR